VGVGLDGDTVVDASGQSVIPGLIDCHTHVGISHIDFWRHAETPFSYRVFETAANLATTLALGITTIRDAGGADLGVKQAVLDGLIPGPRMQIAINMISQTAGTTTPGWPPGSASTPSSPSTPGAPQRWSTAPTRCAGWPGR
jgi:imidazolonepropionase-like amidohydrolase